MNSNSPVFLFLNILQNAVRILAGVGVDDKVIQQITGLIQFAGSLVREGEKGYAELETVNNLIDLLVEQGRGPTEEEWAVWDSRLRTVDERFARLKASLSG